MPHRPTADALDTAEQLRPCPPAAAVVAHAAEDVADVHIPVFDVRLLTRSTWPHRSHSTRRNHDGNAANDSSKASSPVGRGSLP
jgi:hypothetical protein